VGSAGRGHRHRAPRSRPNGGKRIRESVRTLPRRLDCHKKVYPRESKHSKKVVYRIRIKHPLKFMAAATIQTKSTMPTALSPIRNLLQNGRKRFDTDNSRTPQCSADDCRTLVCRYPARKHPPSTGKALHSYPETAGRAGTQRPSAPTVPTPCSQTGRHKSAIRRQKYRENKKENVFLPP